MDSMKPTTKRCPKCHSLLYVDSSGKYFCSFANCDYEEEKSDFSEVLKKRLGLDAL